MINRSLMTSKYNDYSTPIGLFEYAEKVWGKFDLDACAYPSNAKCDQFFHKPWCDALQVDWYHEKYSNRIWCNPPYGRSLIQWIRKGYQESRKGGLVVMLIPARTDTKYFQTIIGPYAYHIEFIRGRLRFGGASSTAPFPSMLVTFVNSW